ncbi:MAG: hypothetical protein V4525_02535 [Pseudomonadota bacterium]
MSSTPLVSGLLKMSSQEGEGKTAASREHSGTPDEFQANLRRVLEKQSADSSDKIAKSPSENKPKKTASITGTKIETKKSGIEDSSSDELTMSSMQLALIGSGQVGASNQDVAAMMHAMFGNVYGGLQGGMQSKSGADDLTSSKTSSSRSQSFTNSLSAAPSTIGLANSSIGAASTLGASTLSSLDMSSMQGFSKILEELGLKDIGGDAAAYSGTDTSATQVLLSSNGLATAGLPQADGEGIVASSLKEIQSALKDYWVPPVQVTTQSATEATVRMTLKDGGVLTVHFQLGAQGNAQLRIEAPAAALAALQARLAPLQEALLQQGLTLAPIQWGSIKNAVSQVASTDKVSSSTVKNTENSEESEESNVLAASYADESKVVHAIAASEDLSG